MTVSPRRAALDRMMQRAVPKPVAGFAPPPHELAPGLWALDRQLLHFGVARLPTRSLLVRLAAGGVVVVSPPPGVEAACRQAIQAIGPVEAVVVPNSFHYLFAADVARALTGAALFVPPGLPDRVPALAGASELLEETPAAWAGQLEVAVLGPVRGLSELLFFHAQSESLLLTDVAFHLVRYPRPIDRIIWRLSGMPAGFGPGRTSRNLLLRDLATAAATLERVLEWPFTRIVVAHGETIERDAKDRFRTAFASYLG